MRKNNTRPAGSKQDYCECLEEGRCCRVMAWGERIQGAEAVEGWRCPAAYLIYFSIRALVSRATSARLPFPVFGAEQFARPDTKAGGLDRRHPFGDGGFSLRRAGSRARRVRPIHRDPVFNPVTEMDSVDGG